MVPNSTPPYLAFVEQQKKTARLSEALLWSEKMRSSDLSMANATSQAQRDFAKVLKHQHDESAHELRKVNAIFVSNMMEDRDADRSHMLKMMATALNKRKPTHESKDETETRKHLKIEIERAKKAKLDKLAKMMAALEAEAAAACTEADAARACLGGADSDTE